jgi:hypothetical protein
MNAAWRLLAAAAMCAFALVGASLAYAQAIAPANGALVRSEAAHARVVLDGLPGRAALLQRIRALSLGASEVRDLQMQAGRAFYLRTTAGAADAVLCMREGLAGVERVLVDPRARADAGEGASIAG